MTDFGMESDVRTVTKETVPACDQCGRCRSTTSTPCLGSNVCGVKRSNVDMRITIHMFISRARGEMKIFARREYVGEGFFGGFSFHHPEGDGYDAIVAIMLRMMKAIPA